MNDKNDPKIRVAIGFIKPDNTLLMKY
jgi:hypothetical protein